VGIDGSTGTDTNVEQVENDKPADRHPPRPPDQPGQESEGVSSRLDAHRTRAATKEQAAEKPAEDLDNNKPEASPPRDQQDEQGSGTAEKKPESLASQEATESSESTSNDAPASAPYEAGRDQPTASAQALAGERDTTDRQPTTRDAELGERSNAPETQAAPLDGTTDRDAEEQPGTEGISPTEGTVDNERAPADAAEPEQPTPAESEDAHTDEHLVPVDTAETNDKLAADNTDGEPGPTEGTAPAQETPGAPPDFHGGTIDLPSDEEQRADDWTELAAPTEASEDSDEVREQEAPNSAAEAGPRDLNLMVGDKTLREHIDPAGAGIGEVPEGNKEPLERTVRDKDAPWTEGVDRFDDLPTGEELVEPKPEDEPRDKASRAERARREAFRKSEDAADAAKKNVIIGRGAFERPPDGHPDVKVCPPVPSALDHIRPTHDGVSVENLVSNLLVLGILTGVAASRRGRASREKET
jgi:hypothetical protein